MTVSSGQFDGVRAPSAQSQAACRAVGVRRRVAIAIVAATALLTGCSQSSQVPAADPGTDARTGDVLLRDARMVEPLTDAGAGDRTPTVLLTLVNQADQPDALTAVTTDVAGRVEIRVDPDCNGTAETVSRLELPARADRTDPAERGYAFRLIDLKVGILQATSVPMTFTFLHAGSITVPIPVVTGSGGAAPPAVSCATPGTG